MNGVLDKVGISSIFWKVSNIGKTLTFKLVTNFFDCVLVHFLTKPCIIHPLFINRLKNKEHIDLGFGKLIEHQLQIIVFRRLEEAVILLIVFILLQISLYLCRIEVIFHSHIIFGCIGFCFLPNHGFYFFIIKLIWKILQIFFNMIFVLEFSTDGKLTKKGGLFLVKSRKDTDSNPINSW